MMLNRVKSILIVILLSLPASYSFAQDDSTTSRLRAVENPNDYVPHVGFSLGVGTPEGSRNPSGNYGVEVGFQPYIPISTAVELSYANYDDDDELGGFERVSLLLKGAYNFGGTMPFVRYSYVGLGIGPMWEDTEIGDADVGLGFVPNVGLDYPLRNIMDSALTIGANVSYLVTTTTNPDVFAVNGVVKYWY